MINSKNMKHKIKISTILLCCFLTATALFAQKSEKETITEIEKHFSLLVKAYGSNSIFLLAAEKNYVVENLNFRLLAKTPLYKDYIQYWVGSYQYYSSSREHYEQQLQADILKILARLARQKEETAANNLAKDLADFSFSMGFDNTVLEIVKYMQSIDSEFVSKNRNLSRMLTTVQLLEYKIPPKIVGLKENTYKNCLIIFMDSDCDHCQNEIDKIIKNYDNLTQHGIRVISIAADTNKERYEKYSKKFLWKDKLCDFKGMDGENFNNYGVVGTPVIFLTDKEGKIINSFFYFEDIFKITEQRIKSEE